MKKLITIMIMLVAVGCSKSPEEKPLSPEEKLVGGYEAKRNRDTCKLVFLENGEFEYHVKLLKKEWERKYGFATPKWKIEGNEVHVDFESEMFWWGKFVYKIEPNGDLTSIASIKKGERSDFPKANERTAEWKSRELMRSGLLGLTFKKVKE